MHTYKKNLICQWVKDEGDGIEVYEKMHAWTKMTSTDVITFLGKCCKT
jgi:hypothetical protein